MNKYIIAIIATLLLLTSCGKTEEVNTKEKGFTDDSYYISMEDLKADLDNDNLIIIDARDNKAYNKGHIDGAINVIWQQLSNVSVNSDEKGFRVVLEPKELEKVLQTIGINNDSEIVIYSNGSDGWGEDGRILWTLLLNNFTNVKVLDGTYKHWKDAEYPISKEETKLEKGNIILSTTNTDIVINTADLEKAMEDDSVKIIDTREKAEFDGAQKYGEVKGGHIPRSINIPMVDLFDDNGSVKTKAEVDKIMSDAGISKDDQIITYCTAGIRSAHMLVILKSYGYENVQNYDESFYYWASVNDVE